jgi:prephenate dehydrogenase
MFQRLAVIGVGLIGGSVALALRRAGVVGHVVGIGRGRANLERALALGVIDEIGADPAAGVAQADTVVVAVPVGQFDAVLQAIRPALARDVVITDGGSTKQDVIAAARPALGERWPRFVPAHPIAGAEHSGVEAARAELFDGRNVVLTPVAETDSDAIARAELLWSKCGARVARMVPAEHDRVLAAVSHLPHVLAYALVSMIAKRADAGQLFGFAAGGFRDFTRIASSSPEMWRDIALANRDALLAEIDAYGVVLEAVRDLVAGSDGPALQRLFAEAREAREAWLHGREQDKP